MWGILSLDKKHDKAKIENACKLAYEMNSPSYRTVESLVGLVTSPPPQPSETENTTNPKPMVVNKFVRPMAEYSQLILFNQTTGGKNEPTDINRTTKNS